ncbi:hypothetical protein IAR55_004179 [Kwoniella newhampshirensis]|uniref:Uncharacterized protein n=1 Tax=Kwoniella newhampshirensis TaxID=1651941 RepID=A0AAW0YYY3_9TREE
MIATRRYQIGDGKKHQHQGHFVPLPSTPSTTTRKTANHLGNHINTVTPTPSSVHETRPCLFPLGKKSREILKGFRSKIAGEPKSTSRRATKSALALQQLILDSSPLPASFKPSNGHHNGKIHFHPAVPQLRSKDVDRLKIQLLNPNQANLVIRKIRLLPSPPQVRRDVFEPACLESGRDRSRENGPIRAICLDCVEQQALGLIATAQQAQASQPFLCEKLGEQGNEAGLSREATRKPKPLPILLSLLQSPAVTTQSQAGPPKSLKVNNEADMKLSNDLLPFGLLCPPSALSLHRPLAGALPSSDTLKTGFEALVNAEKKIYDVGSPDHSGIVAPEDRMSVMTYWWGFELAMPPPTLAYLSKVRTICITLLELLSVIVYAVPGGARELAPFVKLISKYIETEFMPAAIVARSWDFDSPVKRSFVVKRPSTIAQ